MEALGPGSGHGSTWYYGRGTITESRDSGYSTQLEAERPLTVATQSYRGVIGPARARAGGAAALARQSAYPRPPDDPGPAPASLRVRP